MRLVIIASGIIVTLGACGDVTEPQPSAALYEWEWAPTGAICTDETPITPLPDSLVGPLPWGTHPTTDDEQAEFARRVPGGYAGRYVENGQLVIMLVDTTKLQAVIAELEETDWYQSMPVVRARQVRWDFGQLYDWYRHLALYLGGLSGLSTMDVNEVENRLQYGVLNEEAREALVSAFQGASPSCHLFATAIVAPIVLLKP